MGLVLRWGRKRIVISSLLGVASGAGTPSGKPRCGAWKANLADLSDVASLKRLRKSNVRAFDATTVNEPGKAGSLWRTHYSVSLPSLACDFFKLTATEGPGTGELFRQSPIQQRIKFWPTWATRLRSAPGTWRPRAVT